MSVSLHKVCVSESKVIFNVIIFENEVNRLVNLVSFKKPKSKKTN